MVKIDKVDENKISLMATNKGKYDEDITVFRGILSMKQLDSYRCGAVWDDDAGILLPNIDLMFRDREVFRACYYPESSDNENLNKLDDFLSQTSQY